MNLRMLVTVALLVAPLTLMAQAPEKPKKPWEGKVTLGYLATSGNTDNSTLNTGFNVSYTVGKWEHKLHAAAINAVENDVTTAEAYDASWKSELNLSEHNFLFGRLYWRKDRFGGFNSQFSQTVGYGRRLIETEKHKLNAELGVGARQSKDQVGIKDNETVFSGAMDYTWKLNDTAEFSQDLSAESGGDNTYLESVTALSTKLLGGLALVASYTVKHNTDVPPTLDKTDTYTALSLEYKF